MRLILAIALAVCSWVTQSMNVMPIAFFPTETHRTYTTNFPLKETPISEGSNWANGGSVGFDWTNVSTTTGLAIGTESGTNGYDDSTAVLTGRWGATQTAQATVHTVNQKRGIFQEVELRLRTTITAHSITGYEINFRCSPAANAYTQIVRWNGPINSFTILISSAGPGLKDGDIVKTTIVGHVITS